MLLLVVLIICISYVFYMKLTNLPTWCEDLSDVFDEATPALPSRFSQAGLDSCGV